MMLACPDKKVLIVGGGDTAMEDVSFLKKFTKKVTVVQILDHLTASEAMKERVLNDSDIKIIYNSTVTEIRGDDKHVSDVTIFNKKTNESTIIDVDGIFIAIGLNPSTKIFKGQLAMNEFEYLQIKSHTNTSILGVFAAGDVYDYRYKQAITAASSGCMAAIDAERYLKDILFE